MRGRADEVGIHAAAEAIRAIVSLPLAINLRELACTCRLRRVNARPADRRREQARSRKRGIADNLGLQAQTVLTCEESVARVGLRRVGPVRRSLPVSRGIHDQPVHVLEVPIPANEFRSHPIQQLGVAGQRSLGTEIVLRLHDPQSEIALPDPIHGHSRRQRIVFGNQPAC